MDYLWKEVKKYACIYYKLGEIFNNIETRKDDQGWSIEEHKPTEGAVKEMVEVLREEGINEKEEILGFIMQSSKGQANPKIVNEILSRL